MEGQSGNTKSYWMNSAQTPQFGPLESDVNDVDVCIVGAGITGLTTAYLLVQEGKSVVVLDDGPIAAGETQRTTAHLTNVIDDGFTEMKRIHGVAKTRLAAESHSAAIDKIEEIVNLEGIHCDFKRLDGYLFLGDKQHKKCLEDELEVLREIDFQGVEMLDRVPIGLEVTCLRFPKQGQFHILKYVSGLCKAITERGGRIYSFEHVQTIDDGETVTVKTNSGRTVTAKNLVVATNSPVSDRVKIHTKQAPYRTFAIGVRITAGSIPPGLYWDTEDPYHYVRLQPTDSSSHEMLIVGGEDHRTGQEDDAEERFARLEQWTREKFPVVGTIEFRWSGQVYEPDDGLAFIGRDPAHGKNVFVATGDSGMGMTHGTIAGILLTDLICGRENPWKELYDPSRKMWKAGLEYAGENLNTAAQYMDLLTPSDVPSVEEIQPGEGAIIRRGLQKVAVYKDENGKVHERSAFCKHLGAVVCWNSCEKSWDCPAHGSRFDPYGEVINGPSNRNLDSVDTESEEKEHKKSA